MPNVVNYTRKVYDDTPAPTVDQPERKRIREALAAIINAATTALASVVTWVNAKDSLVPTSGEKTAIGDIVAATGATTAAKLVGLVRPTIMGLFSSQAVASAASATGLTAGATYSYFVLSPADATYGSAVQGSGTGTEIMAMAASANLLLLLIKTAEAA
jgi:hypothetical protein